MGNIEKIPLFHVLGRTLRGVALAVTTAVAVGIVPVLSCYSGKPLDDSTSLRRIVLFVATVIFLNGIITSLGDVLHAYRVKFISSKMKLEIKNKDGILLATGLDPSDLEQLAKVVRENKSASQ
jgi:hypothetical protein